MTRIAFMNTDKVNYDGQINFNSLRQVSELIEYVTSTPDEIASKSEGCDCIVVKELPMNGKAIDTLPDSVRLICEAGTGYNNIDVEAAAQRGIAVTNVPTYASESVAHLVIASIFNLTKSIHLYTRAAGVSPQSWFDHEDVMGKTVGIVGATGNTAQKLIPLLNVMGMSVLGTSRSAHAGVNDKIHFTTLEELLRCSDYVVLLCPLNAQSRHLINPRTLSLMKPTSFLINVARGSIVDELALIRALEAGVIKGAALDVLEIEPPQKNNPLLHMSNVLITPHMGWRSVQSRQKLIDEVANNIKHFFSNKPLHLVNAVNADLSVFSRLC